MTVEEFLKVLKALGIDPSTPLEDAIAKIKGGAADGAPPSSQPGEPADGSGGDGAPPAAAAAADPNAKPPAEKPEDVAASVAKFLRMTDAKSFTEAVTRVEAFRTSHLELETTRQSLAAERATLESAERRRLCVELVTMGAEFPSTVWADDKSTTLKPRWLNMPLAELRTHATEQRAARGGKKNPTPPASQAVGGVSQTFQVGSKLIELSATELAICAEQKCEPAVYAALKAQRDGGT